MSSFARFVSRKMLRVIAVFAVVAAATVGGTLARGDAGSAPGTVDLESSLSDPEAFAAILDDPTVAASDRADQDRGRQQLRADVRAARALEGDARREALAAIRARAQDGEYGDGIERRADRRQVRHDLFLSLLPDDLRADLTELKSASADKRAELRGQILDRALAGDYGPEVQHAAEQLQALRDGRRTDRQGGVQDG